MRILAMEPVGNQSSHAFCGGGVDKIVWLCHSCFSWVGPLEAVISRNSDDDSNSTTCHSPPMLDNRMLTVVGFACLSSCAPEGRINTNDSVVAAHSPKMQRWSPAKEKPQ
jgi:hypothetical protein